MDFRPPADWGSSLKIGTCSWKYDSRTGRIKTYLNVNNHYEGSATLTIGWFLETPEAETPALSEEA
jgi:hypothetical protein